MEKLNEKSKVAEKDMSGIKKERLEAINKKYQSPEWEILGSKNNVVNDCSDMASITPCAGGQGCASCDIDTPYTCTLGLGQCKSGMQ